MADAARRLPALPVAVGAGKSADPVPDAPAPDASFLQRLHVPWALTPPDAAAELCRLDADLSAEQSFVAQAFAVQLPQAERRASVEPVQVPSERRKL